MSLRIGAVGYLNARPLTWALDREPSRWQVRYDLPSVCARLLQDGEVDLGLVPSIEYLQSPDYRFVPGVGVTSRGAIASVALYSTRRIDQIRHIALDTSSRTSVALIQVLCRHHFRISPRFVPHGPDLAVMTRDFDAGLLIGDPAFEADHVALGLEKIELQVPGPNETAARHLLSRGFRIDPWVNLLMANRPFGQFDRLLPFGPPLFL